MARSSKSGRVRPAGQVLEDSTAIEILQRKYAAAVLERGDLPPEILAKYQRMQKLYAKAFKGKKVDEKAMAEGAALAKELLPYFHFKVDDVNRNKL